MQWLNYHHLLYFWAVAREGSVARASKELGLAQPTVSGQVHQLEELLGEKLFARKGRGLVLTEVGRIAFRYADEIFSLGREMLDAVQSHAAERPLRLVVGVSDALPKSVVRRIVEPALHLGEPVQLVCRADRSTTAFMTDLAAHAVDIVLSDAPAPAASPVRAFSHPLGECGTVLFAAPKRARALRARFPHSLHGAPFLLPGVDSALRRSLESWFSARGIRPEVVAELDDTALAEALGEGLGVFAAPDVVEREIRLRHRVQLVGRVPEVRQRFFAISVERKIRHPAVLAICQVARTSIFG